MNGWIKLTRDGERAVALQVSAIIGVTEAGEGQHTMVHVAASTFFVSESQAEVLERIRAATAPSAITQNITICPAIPPTP